MIEIKNINEICVGDLVRIIEIERVNEVRMDDSTNEIIKIGKINNVIDGTITQVDSSEIQYGYIYTKIGDCINVDYMLSNDCLFKRDKYDNEIYVYREKDIGHDIRKSINNRKINRMIK